MSRGDSSGQFIFEFAALGNALSTWIDDEKNKALLGKTIEDAVAEYEKNRTDRMNFLGKPDFSSSENTDTAIDTQETTPSLLMEEQTLSDVAVSFAANAASTALNYARLFVAKTADYALSDSAKQFRALFPVVDHDNAQIAFLYNAYLSSTWAVENHGGMGRASLNTLIFSRVFDEFMKQDCAMFCFTEYVDLDGEDGGVEMISWKPSSDTAPEPSMLAKCIADYKEKRIDPLRIPDQAKKIFTVFASTPVGIKLNKQLQAVLNLTPALSK